MGCRSTTFAILTATLLLAGGAGVARAEDSVTVELGNRSDGSMFLTFDHRPVTAGKVTFHIKNVSKDMEHEFIVGRTALHLDELPLTGDGTQIDEEKALSEIHELEDLAPGDSGTLVVHLQPGHYVALCNLPGHALAGMATEFEVVPESGSLQTGAVAKPGTVTR